MVHVYIYPFTTVESLSEAVEVKDTQVAALESTIESLQLALTASESNLREAAGQKTALNAGVVRDHRQATSPNIVIKTLEIRVKPSCKGCWKMLLGLKSGLKASRRRLFWSLQMR